MNNNKKGRLVIFAGPSGSGKDTVLSEVLKKVKDGVKLTTATTREPRDGEVNTRDYYFISREEFLDNIKKGLIPEHNEHAGNLYGVYLPDLEKKILEHEVVFGQVQLVGAKFLKEKYNALLFFINAESMDILEERIRSRSSLPEEEIKDRIETAKREVEKESAFYDYIIVNKQNHLEETVDEVLEILKKEGVV
jgi:guanylate kinase